MYAPYADYVRSIVSTRDISTFKSNPKYTYMLEHVLPSSGKEYYTILRNDYSLSDETISSFCTKNDAIGSPIRCMIGSLPHPVSPTSLRYLVHASTILDHLVSHTNDTRDIVELGCGYGGLALALDFVSTLRSIPISSYTCVDLDAPLALQKLYLQNFTLSFPIDFHSASTYGAGITKQNMFFVSMYCFSEIETEHQIGYIRRLLPKVSHGVMLWNMIPVFDFGKTITCIDTERPLTAVGNKIVLF